MFFENVLKILKSGRSGNPGYVHNSLKTHALCICSDTLLHVNIARPVVFCSSSKLASFTKRRCTFFQDSVGNKKSHRLDKVESDMQKQQNLIIKYRL